MSVLKEEKSEQSGVAERKRVMSGKMRGREGVKDKKTDW